MYVSADLVGIWKRSGELASFTRNTAICMGMIVTNGEQINECAIAVLLHIFVQCFKQRNIALLLPWFSHTTSFQTCYTLC